MPANFPKLKQFRAKKLLLWRLEIPDITNITRSYFVKHMITLNSMRLLLLLLASLDFKTFLPKMWNFLTWWSKFKCRLQRTCKAPEKTNSSSLMIIYQGKEITRLKCYRTNFTDCRSKNIKSTKPLKIRWFCWSNYH